MLYTDSKTCKARLSNTHMAGKKRYELDISNLYYKKVSNVYEAYHDAEAETIEEIIAQLGNFVSEIIIFYPALIFDNEESRDTRKEKIGFTDNATGGYKRYELGDLIDSYIKKRVVDSIPVFDDFALGVEVNGERWYF